MQQVRGAPCSTCLSSTDARCLLAHVLCLQDDKKKEEKDEKKDKKEEEEDEEGAWSAAAHWLGSVQPFSGCNLQPGVLRVRRQLQFGRFGV